MFFFLYLFSTHKSNTGPGALFLLSICLLIFFFFFPSLLPGPANPIRMQHLSPLISPQKLMVSQLVSCLSDNMDLEYQPVCNNEGGPGVFTWRPTRLAGLVSPLSRGKSPESSCPYQCTGSPLTAGPGCILHDSGGEVAVICQHLNKIKPPTGPPGRQWEKIFCSLWYGNGGHRH